MLNEITTALASLKAASDIIKGFNSLQVDVAVKEKSSELFNIIITLQSNILSMQSEYGELLESKNNIEKELVELKKLVSDKSNYELVQIDTGIFAYTQKSDSNAGNPKHYLCQNCFDNKNYKSILQRKFPLEPQVICYSCNIIHRLNKPLQ
ncbi:MAG: hypothetical protein WC879_08710 [Melioribacteraceae bacterium]